MKLSQLFEATKNLPAEIVFGSSWDIKNIDSAISKAAGKVDPAKEMEALIAKLRKKI